MRLCRVFLSNGTGGIYDFVCDACCKRYRKRVKKSRLSLGLSFCSRECYAISRQIGGKSYSQARVTSKKRYGVDHPMQAKVIKDKLRNSFKTRYGVEHNSQLMSWHNSVIATNFSRRGVPWAVQADSVRARARLTMQSRYGVSHFTETGIPSKKSAAPSAREKRWESLKQNGMVLESKIERDFGDVLREMHGIMNVDSHVTVNRRWSIDFYIRSIDCYVQFDGMFWHGLDRAIAEIRSSNHAIDFAIARKWRTDRDQEKWFFDSGKTLVRVTDYEFEKARSCGVDGILKLLDDKSLLK